MSCDVGEVTERLENELCDILVNKKSQRENTSYTERGGSEKIPEASTWR